MSETLNIEIAGRKIGQSEPTFVIAEIGVNHNGDIDLAHKLIDGAIESGADAVKFQKTPIEEIEPTSKKDQKK